MVVFHGHSIPASQNEPLDIPVYDSADSTLMDAKTIITSGVSATIDTSAFRRLWLVALVKGAVTGTTPKLVVTVEQVDGSAAQNYITIHQLADVIATAYVTQDIGTNYLVGGRMRIRWTVTGTTPSFPNTDISLVGEVRDKAIGA